MSEFWRRLSQAAQALDWLQPPPVFIGGAVIPFFLDAFGQAQMRPTLDVDCVVPGVCTRMDYAKLEEALRGHGWAPDMNGPICRYLGPEQLIVDFMVSDPCVLGFSGRWYPSVVESATAHMLPDGHNIWLPDVGVLLACKLDAFFDRGMDEPVESKDLEDIVALLDGCDKLEDTVGALKPDVLLFVSVSMQQLSSNAFLRSVAETQLPRGGDETARIRRFRERLRKLAND